MIEALEISNSSLGNELSYEMFSNGEICEERLECVVYEEENQELSI